MPLDKQNIDIPFAGGVSKKLDKVLVDKARLLSLSNGTLNKNGTIQRRDPWAALNGSPSLTPIEMATLNGELLAVDSVTNNLYAYSQSAGAKFNRGQVPSFSLSTTQITRAYGNVLALDAAQDGNYTCYAWLQTGGGGAVTGVFATIYDEASRSFLLSGYQLSSSSTAGAPRVVVAQTGSFTVFWGDSGHIKGLVMTSFGAVTVGSTDIVTDYVGTSSAAPLDVISLGLGNSLILYASTTSSNQVSAIVTAPGLTLAQAEIAVSATGISNIYSIGAATFGVTSTIGFIFKQAGVASLTGVLSWSGTALTVAYAATTTGFGVGSGGGAVTMAYNGTSMQVFDFPYRSGAGVVACMTGTLSSVNMLSSAGTLANSIQFSGGLNGPSLAGKAFAVGSSFYVPIAITSSVQPCLYVMDSTGLIQAMALYGSLNSNAQAPSFGPLSTWGGVVPSCQVSSGVVNIPTSQLGQVSFTEGVETTPAGVTRVRLVSGRTAVDAYAAPLWHAQTADSLYFSGAFMAMYDGSAVSEAGFVYFPENVALASFTGSGGTTGTFSFVAVYEWVDNQGHRHQSAPSAPVAISVSNKQGVTYQAATLLFGRRAANCSVVFYRTVNAGTTYYRINSAASPLANDPTTYKVGATDTTINSTATSDPIAANEQLYTGGGELPNDCPVACGAIGTYQGRIVYNNAESQHEWRFSQAPIAGQGLYFNEGLLGGVVPQEAGQPSAFATLDDKLVVFTQTNKLWISGQGPTSDGLNGSYSSPQLLPSDVGCTDQRSLALLPDLSATDGPVQLSNQGGLGHQTKHGYYLLGRGLTDAFIGMADDSDLGGAVVTSAVVCQDKHQLRLTVPGASLVAVFDYLMGQWSTFTSQYSIAPQSAIIWNGVYTYGGPATLYQDSPGLSGGDLGTAPVVVSQTTAWIKLAALQGFQRVWRALFFGPYSSASNIQVTAAFDYDTSLTVSAPVMASASLLTGDGARWQFRWHLPRQKCEAVQFTLTDTPTGGSASGVGFSGMTLELGVKRGTAKLPAAQST